MAQNQKGMEIMAQIDNNKISKWDNGTHERFQKSINEGDIEVIATPEELQGSRRKKMLAIDEDTIKVEASGGSEASSGTKKRSRSCMDRSNGPKASNIFMSSTFLFIITDCLVETAEGPKEIQGGSRGEK